MHQVVKEATLPSLSINPSLFLQLIPLFTTTSMHKPVHFPLLFLVKWHVDPIQSNLDSQIAFSHQILQYFVDLLSVIYRAQSPPYFRLLNISINGGRKFEPFFLTCGMPGLKIIKPITARRAACQKSGTRTPRISSQRRGNTFTIGSLDTAKDHLEINSADTSERLLYPIQ